MCKNAVRLGTTLQVILQYVIILILHHFYLRERKYFPYAEGEK